MKILRNILILACYGSLALPGHAGLHALLGDTACSHLRVNTTDAKASAAGCDCAHEHSHSSDDAPTDSHAPHPQDDEEHCELHQWFCQGQTLVSGVVVSDTVALDLRHQLESHSSPLKLDFRPQLSRGPPCV